MDVTPTDVAKVVGVCPVIDVGMVRQQDNLYQVLFMILHVYVVSLQLRTARELTTTYGVSLQLRTAWAYSYVRTARELTAT